MRSDSIPHYSNSSNQTQLILRAPYIEEVSKIKSIAYFGETIADTLKQWINTWENVFKLLQKDPTFPLDAFDQKGLFEKIELNIYI